MKEGIVLHFTHTHFTVLTVIGGQSLLSPRILALLLKYIYIYIRVCHFCTFFEFFVGIFYFMHKCYKTAPKKIWGHLEPVWPPHCAFQFSIEIKPKTLRKSGKSRKSWISFQQKLHFTPSFIMSTHSTNYKCNLKH